MLSRIRTYLLNPIKQGGFSLVEALVATALVGVGFAGTFALTAETRKFSDKAIAKQKLQMLSNQILAVIETDLTNIDNYNIDLKTCTAATTTEKYDVRRYEWCIKMQADFGTATALETRNIAVTTLADGTKAVHIKLEVRGQNVQVVMKRTYDN